VSKYLNEHEVDFDPDNIGFPNLGDCMAVVLLTEAGLFGHHITPGNARQAGAFATFISSRTPGTMLRLYGTCYRENRYGGAKSTKADWKQEMTRIANLLVYSGPVSGFDTSASSTGITKDEQTYVEYQRNGRKCKVFYKRMGKMTVTLGANPTADPTKRAFRLPGTDAYTNDPADFALKDQPMKIATAAAIVRTDSNKGNLHEVSSISIDSFDV
jgi:hypothetical protein